MARFVYTAEKNDGEVYKGIAEATDRFDLYAIVRREGGKIISVNEQASSKWSISYWNSRLTTIKEYDKILMARNLGAMISAGLSLSRSLAVLERQTKNPRLCATISEVASDVRRGETLHGAVARFPHVFSQLFVAMIRAGEEGGDLPTSLAVTSDQMERMFDLKKKIKGALIYPSIILVAIVGIGAVMMVVVVPSLSATFSEMGASLPKSTLFVIGLSNFLIQNTAYAIGILITAVVLVYTAIRTTLGQHVIDFILLHLPGVAPMVKEVNAARTARTMASLLTSGVDVITALEITREVVQNSYFRSVINAAKDGVAQGQPLSAEFTRNEHLYPPFVGEMMSVGEETGQTAEMLKRLAIFYEVEVDRKTKDMSTIIEPFLMLFIGAAVGFFAIAMISPIYSLSSQNF